ncbi:MAG TPA: hypothetical protein VFN30_13420 [Chitinophagaceae bacterium]|nr:hypothetical protein [Chitinophagaceae bacterium]
MPIKNLSYNKLEPLINDNLSTEEDLPTAALIKKLRSSKKRGWLTKDEMIEICRWKSPRAVRYIEANSKATIKKHTASAFATRSEDIKIQELTKLKGVSIPMASSILMLTNPKRYGVIDIRVWEVMLEIGTVNTNPKGVNFNFKEWYRYLVIIRHFAYKFKVSARDIERTLFIVHQNNQDGQLYRNLTKAKK